MQGNDFILYDDPDNNANSLNQHVSFKNPAFFKHRGQALDTSPLFDEAQYNAPIDTNHSQSSSENVSRVSPATLKSNSPYATPPNQPSSGTLGAPLDLLSLQGSADQDHSATPHMAPLFPHLPRDDDDDKYSSSSYMTSQQKQQQQRRSHTATHDPNAAAAASLFWNSDGSDASDHLRRWRSYWSTHGGNAPVPSMEMHPDVLRASSESMASFQNKDAGGDDSKLTISPRDLHLDYNEATTPPAKRKDLSLISDAPSLFPSQPLYGDYAQSGSLRLSSGMETSSSTEEEDDEDEKPYTGLNGALLGTTVPNEQLLQQWSRPYGSSISNDLSMPRQSSRDSDSMWPSVGPTFSSVTNSSESEDEMDHIHGTRSMESPFAGNTHEPPALNGSGPMSAYGYIPASSQDSAMSTATEPDSDSRRSSMRSMSVSGSESGGGRDEPMPHRSPTMRRLAQTVHPKQERIITPPESSQPTHVFPTLVPTTQNESTKPLLRSASRSSRISRQDDSDKQPSSTPTQAQSPELSSPDLEDSGSAYNDGESDYEQTHHTLHPAPRTTARRGRPPRALSAQHKQQTSGAHHNTFNSPSTAAAHGAPRQQASSPISGSAIRCDYVSPLTHQMCGTVFHRMYDLARHRITLHLREEAQLVKDGVLGVDKCVVLGKEVDVQKALAELEWTCRICGSSFSRKDAMLRHERLRHHR